ncbi:MAG: prolipoprotein diacylglyceryl transferase [Bdellovibrionales bacterium]|nr:prolipoprotein diacylglyceryl transferase [Bdellovibrionales bacterium]
MNAAYLHTAYLHTMDPFAIQFTESFGIRWYGLAYLAGFGSGYLITAWLLTKPRMLLPSKLLSDFVFAVAVGCIVGGRLGYCVFYRPELLWDFRDTIPFWGALAVNEGGMASHGGVIGMTIACVYFGWRHRISILHLGDLVIYGSTLGIFCGRVANFINGELVGRVCEGKCWFPVKFPQDILTWPAYEPGKLTQLSDVVSQIGISKEKWLQLLGQGDGRAIDVALQRLIHEVQNGNEAVQLGLAKVLVERYPSQLYAAFLEGGIIFLILFWLWRKPLRPGIISSLFLILYPIGRVLSEQFRQPDLHIGFQALGLTRGQWLSVAMVLLSLMLFVFVARRKAERLGGWASE